MPRGRLYDADDLDDGYDDYDEEDDWDDAPVQRPLASPRRHHVEALLPPLKRSLFIYFYFFARPAKPHLLPPRASNICALPPLPVRLA